MQVMRIIYGPGVDYGKMVTDGIVETLEERRRSACTRFANKAIVNPRFGNRWFKRSQVERTVRSTTRRVYEERR